MANKNEAKIKFAADTAEFSAAIKRASSEMTQLRGELKLNQAQMANTGQSVEGLAKSKALLERQDQALSSKIDALNAKYEAARGIWGANSAEAQRYANQIVSTQAAQERLRGQIQQVTQALDAQRAADARADSALGKLTATIARQGQEVDRLADEYKSAVIQYGATSDEAKRLEKALSKAAEELDNSKDAMKSAVSAADKLTGALDNAKNSSKDAKNSIAELAAGTVAGDYGHEAISVVIDDLRELVAESDLAASKLKAAFGSYGEDQFGELTDMLHDIYSSNYGDSFDDIAESAREVVNVLGNDLRTDVLQQLTTDALVLRDSFDVDVNESIMAANQLMTHFGLDGKAAYDLLALGCQEGLNANGEWFDAVSEYAGYYEQLGLSAEDMFLTMAAGSQQFLMGTDKAGDAIKELSIRSIDMSKTSEEGYKILGLSMEDYAGRIAQGGDTARDATLEIMDALMACEDPVQQNIAGVALFGTMWEDLGSDGMGSLMGLMGAAVDAAGTMEDIDSIRYDNVGDQAEGLKRRFEEDILGPVVDVVQPGLKGFFGFVNENFTIVVPLVLALASAFGVVAASLAFTSAINALKVAWAGLNITMGLSPVTIVALAVIGLVAAFALLWSNCEGFRVFWTGLWNGVMAAVQPIFDWLMANVITPVSAAFQGFASEFSLLWDGIVASVSAYWSALTVNVIGPGLEFLQMLFNAVLPALSAIWDAAWNVIWVTASFIWSQITNFITTAMGAIQGIIQIVTGIISGDWNAVWGGIGQFFSSIINGITQAGANGLQLLAGIVSSVIGGIVNFWSSSWSGVLSFFSSVAGSIYSTASSIFNGVKDAITNPIETAKNIIQGIVGTIKGFFDNFHIRLPHISLPHFVISPAGWQVGDLLQGKIPSLSIQWYDKGGIMTRPTVFGVNGNSLMVGGERRSEAILPIELLQGFIDNSFGRYLPSGILQSILVAIERLDAGLGDKIADNAPDTYPGDRAFRAALRKAGVQL